MTPSFRRFRVRRVAMQAAACLLAFSQTGCPWVVLIGYVFGGPPTVEPDFDKTTGKSMTAKDVTVAVVCYAPNEVKWDFDEIDMEIAKYVTYRLHEKQIKVINPDRVRVWLDKNPNWDKPEEIGAAFNTTYVVYIDLHKYSLYEENSTQLYRGRCDGWVTVVEMDKDGHGDKIFSKEINSKYPLNVPRATSECSYMNFKREYLSRLSEEVGRNFYEIEHGTDITAAM